MSEERTKQLREDSGAVVYTDALTSFLYELMRDHLPAGVVEQLVRTAVNEPEENVFTNGWLAKYANNLAEQLNNAKTDNLAKILSEAFGTGVERPAVESRPSFKSDEETLEERTNDSKKVIDTLVQSGQLNPDEAEEIKKEIEEFERESLEQQGKAEESVVTTNDSPELKFTKTE